MKLAIVLVFGSFSFGESPERQQERARDEWFGRDKAKHFVVSAALQSVGHSVLRSAGSDYADASLTAGALTLSVGVGKELWDRSQGKIFSWRDITADALGGGTAAVVIRQIDR